MVTISDRQAEQVELEERQTTRPVGRVIPSNRSTAHAPSPGPATSAEKAFTTAHGAVGTTEATGRAARAGTASARKRPVARWSPSRVSACR